MMTTVAVALMTPLVSGHLIIEGGETDIETGILPLFQYKF